MLLKWRLRNLISYTFIFCLVAQITAQNAAAAASLGMSMEPSEKKSATPLHPAFEAMEFAGKPYQYYERHAPTGKLIGQYLVGKDRTEIMLDNNGDGRLDSWEIFTPGGKILMSAPRLGQFMNMDLEVRTKKGIVQYRYFWNRRSKLYTLYDMKARRYATFGYTSQFIIGCLGDTAGLSLENLSEQLNAKLNDASELSTFKQNITNQAMDSSCTTGDFKQSAPLIANGIAAIATSEKDGKWTSSAGTAAGPTERGMYLQCMRHYGLFAQAARIESAFAQYTSVVPDNKFLWKITCGNKSSTDVGTYVEGQASTPPRIEMHATQTEMKQYLQNPNATQEQMTQGYGRVFFHEMLHYSMMSENDAHMVEDCCADPDGASDKEAKCAYLQSATQRALYSQGLQNSLMDTFANSGESYAAFEDGLSRGYPDTQGVDALHLTYNSLGEVYDKYAKMPECTSTGDKENPFGKCSDQYKAEAEAIIKKAYGPQDGSDCRNKVDAQYGVDGAKSFCGQTMGIVETLLGKKPVPCTKTKTTASTIEPSLFSYVTSLFSSSVVNAQSDGYAGGMCAISSDLKVDVGYDLGSYAPPVAVGSQLVQGTVPVASNTNANSTLGGSGSSSSSGGTKVASSSIPTSSSSSSSGSSSKTSYDVNSGPSRPYFSNDSSPRANEIVKHIQNSDGLIQNFQKVAEKSFDTLIPRAQAESSVVNTVYKASSYDGSTVARIPKISVPDPMGNLGANGGASQPLPSRAPASIPQAGSLPVVSTSAAQGVRVVAGAKIDPATGRPNRPGAAGQVAGLNPAAALTQEKARKAASAAEERARKSLMLFLKNKDYFKQVKPELSRPTVEASLLDHKVQVVDDEGKVHGSGFPSAKLIFDVNKNYLVDAPLGGQ